MNFIYLVIAAGVAGLSGCASHAPAPVVERGASAPAPVASARPAVPVPAVGESRGGYTVKKGDTLYGIALEHGQDYKDVAAWNNIDNPHRIQTGQQLRVAPPDREEPVAVAKPVLAVAPVVAGAVEASTESYKRDPKGGKVVYSEEALARLREGDAAPAPTQPEPAHVEEKPVDKPPVAVPVGDNAIDWAWPAPGKVMTSFVEGVAGKESNKGIDLAGKMGEPVLAAADGVVSYVGSGLRGYGNLVVIRHNAAFLTVYAHNSRILVKEKQSVTRGQKIAEIGNSDADQVKLHFEIRRQGKPVDPLKHLPTR